MSSIVHLVDDDSGVRETLARLLESGGYAVHEYASGLELLALPDEAIDGFCILLDVDMPGGDGFAVPEALKNRSVEVPVVIMTGAGDLTIAALKAGASEFMQKPFGRSELLTVLDQLPAKRIAAEASAT